MGGLIVKAPLFGVCDKVFDFVKHTHVDVCVYIYIYIFIVI